MTYACPAWEFSADTYILKFQRLRNKVLRTFGELPKCTPVSEVPKSFQELYINDYVTKLGM
jgi:hypothetical protein